MSWEKIGETDKYFIWKKSDDKNQVFFNVFDKNYIPNENTGGYLNLQTILQIKNISDIQTPQFFFLS